MMWKVLVLLLAVTAFSQASEIQNDDAAKQQDENMLTNKAEFTDDEPQDDTLAEPNMLTNQADFTDDESQDLSEDELSKLVEASEEIDDQEEANDAQVNEEDSKMAEQDTKKDEEPKLFQRGWRRRRRRRRPSPPPSPIRPCGRGRYNIHSHSCCFNRFVRPKGKCPVFHCTRLRHPKSSVTYNPFIHRCCYGSLVSRKSRCPVHRCGRYSYNPRFMACCHRGWRKRLYNFHTHKCCYGIPIAKCFKCHPWAKCGHRLYSPWLYRCCARRYIYSLHFQKCCRGRVTDKQAICGYDKK